MQRSLWSFILLFFLLSHSPFKARAQSWEGNAPFTLAPISKELMEAGGDQHQSRKKIEVEDINGDERPDLWIRTKKAASFWVNRGGGNFERTDSLPSSGWDERREAFSSYLHDLNRDAHPDLLLIEKKKNDEEKDRRRRRRGRKRILIPYINDGEGHFKRKAAIDTGAFPSFELLPSTDKGDPFLIVGERRKLHAYLARANGTFKKVLNELPVPHDLQDARSTDVDKDGLKDLILRYNGSTMVLCSNQGEGNFKKAFQKTSDERFMKKLEDHQELGLLNESEQWVRFRRFHPNGDKIKADTLSPEDPVLTSSLEDLDGNGDPELVMITKKEVRIYSAPWEEDLELKQRIPSRSNSQRISFKDLNGDGKKDLLRMPGYMRGHRDSSKIRTYLNEGDGTFRNKKVLDLKGNSASEAHFADLDGDSTLELLLEAVPQRHKGNALGDRPEERANAFDPGLLAIHRWDQEEKNFRADPSFLPLPFGTETHRGQEELIKSEDMNGDGAEDLLVGSNLYLKHPEKGEKNGEGNEPMFITLFKKAHGSKERMIVAGDPDGDPLTLSLKKAPDSAKLEDIGNGIAFLSHPPFLKAPLERSSFKIRAKDGKGNELEQQFELPNKIPKSAKDWTFKTHNLILSRPTFNKKTLYVGSFDGRLHAVDASNGKERWHYQSEHPIRSSPLIKNSTVYFTSGKVKEKEEGSGRGAVYAVNASTGEELWKVKTSGAVTGSPALSNGTLYVGDHSGSFYALDAETGKELWRTCTCVPIGGTPLADNGKVFFGSAGPPRKDGNDKDCSLKNCKNFFALKDDPKEGEKPRRGRRRANEKSGIIALDASNGKKLWVQKKAVHGPVTSDLLTHEGRLVLTIGNGHRRYEENAQAYLGLDSKTGKKLWSYEIKARKEYSFGSSGAPAHDEGVIFHIGRDKLHGIEMSSGKVRWSRNLDMDENRIDDLELYLHQDRMILIPSELPKGPGGTERSSQMKVLDRKEGTLDWSFSSKNEHFIHAIIPHPDKGSLYMVSERILHGGPRSAVRGSGYIHALRLDQNARDRDVEERECRAAPKFQEFKRSEGSGGYGPRTDLSKKGFTYHFKNCEPAILEYDHPWLTPHASHKIIGRTDDGGCRIRTRLRMEENPMGVKLPSKTIRYTLDPKEPFAPQLEKAIKSSISQKDEGFDRQGKEKKEE